VETAVDEVAELSVRLRFRWRRRSHVFMCRTSSADHCADVKFQYSVCGSGFTLPPRPKGRQTRNGPGRACRHRPQLPGGG
jgi:hypothetical protein